MSGQARTVRAGESEIPLRVTLVSPPGGVQFCLQGRNNELVDKVRTTGEDLSFDLTIQAIDQAGGVLRFLGRFTQGPPDKRFLYVCSGTCAGDMTSCWTRRAKIPLSGITVDLVRQLVVAGSARLEARIKGTAKDGGPVCASVPVLGDGWRIITT